MGNSSYKSVKRRDVIKFLKRKGFVISGDGKHDKATLKINEKIIAKTLIPRHSTISPLVYRNIGLELKEKELIEDIDFLKK